MSDLRQRIQDVIDNEPVTLFMKGTPQFVMCGNSDRALRALREAGAPVTAVDILPDFSRNGIPIGFYDAASERGRRMLRNSALESPDLPVVVLRFGGSSRRWSTRRTWRSPTRSA